MTSIVESIEDRHARRLAGNSRICDIIVDICHDADETRATGHGKLPTCDGGVGNANAGFIEHNFNKRLVDRVV